MSTPTGAPTRPEQAVAPITTWLAGGPLHGRQICAASTPVLEVEGHIYRHANGPYYPGRKGPYQVYVLAALTAEAAADALRELFVSNPLDILPSEYR